MNFNVEISRADCILEYFDAFKVQGPCALFGK